jgi:hypothetical protein
MRRQRGVHVKEYAIRFSDPYPLIFYVPDGGNQVPERPTIHRHFVFQLAQEHGSTPAGRVTDTQLFS